MHRTCTGQGEKKAYADRWSPGLCFRKANPDVVHKQSLGCSKIELKISHHMAGGTGLFEKYIFIALHIRFKREICWCVCLFFFSTEGHADYCPAVFN